MSEHEERVARLKESLEQSKKAGDVRMAQLKDLMVDAITKSGTPLGMVLALARRMIDGWDATPEEKQSAKSGLEKVLFP